MRYLLLTISLIIGIMRNSAIEGRALMIEPPQRSSLWRFNYEAHMNIQDDTLNCGGYEVQWESNGGKCGVCGDPYWGPLNHDDKGVYASGNIVRSYEQGTYVNVTVEVLSNLLGYFEFRLCPRNGTETKLTHECFQQNLLWIEESWGTRYYVGSRGGIYDLHVRLPENIICSSCVFQWKYSTGYRMGGINSCECMGCGRQEQFYNCADVEITKRKDNSTFYQETRTNVHTPLFMIPDSANNLSQADLQKIKEQIVAFPDPKGFDLPFVLVSHPHSKEHPHSHDPHVHHPHTTQLLNIDSASAVLAAAEEKQSMLSPFEQLFDIPPDQTSLRPMPKIIGIHVPSSDHTTGPTVGPDKVPSTDKILPGGVKVHHHITDSTAHIHHTGGRTTASTTRDSGPVDISSPPVVKPVVIPPPPVQLEPLPGQLVTPSTAQDNTPQKVTPIIDGTIIHKESPRVVLKNGIGVVSSDSIIFPLFGGNINGQQINIAQPENGKAEPPKICNERSPTFQCKGKGLYKDTRGMDVWCLNNCRSGNCVQFMCDCGCQEPKRDRRCHAIGTFETIPGMDDWCARVCSGANCPSNICSVEDCVRSDIR